MENIEKDELLECDNSNYNDEILGNLTSIYNLLVRERIYLKFKEVQDKIASRDFSDRALAALNIGFREAQKLCKDHHDLTQQAKILEKIQIAAAEAERFAAFTKADRQAFYYSHLAQKIADISRSYFHKNKEVSDAA
ncbi:MAG: hypothetical protein HYT76_08490 [Deltaproteobacteria bacterium]|nr:hypothetical protein [Deltaproteobacteria bacterium]